MKEIVLMIKEINLLYLGAYIISICMITAILFSVDKAKAKKGRYRTPESRLHFMEALGGVFIVVPLMYLIRHKNRKASYYIVTWLILVTWLVILTVPSFID